MNKVLATRYWLGLLLLVSILFMPAAPVVQAQQSGTQGTIIVAVAANAPPFAAQAENGEIVGFDINIMQTVARTAGLRVHYEAVPFAQLIPGVATRLYDAAIGCIFINDTRRTLVDFTVAYFTTGAVLVYPKLAPPLYDFSDLTEEMVIAVFADSPGEITVKEKSVAQILPFDNEALMVNALTSGNADAILIDEITALRMIRANPEANLGMASGLLSNNQCGIVVSKENHQLLLELNAALTRMKNNGRYLTIYRRWFGTRPLNGPRPLARPTPHTDLTDGGVSIPPAATTALDPLVESALGLYLLTMASEPATYQLLELATDNLWLESMTVPQADTLRGIQTLTTGALQVQSGTWQSTRVDPIAMTVRISATVPLSTTVAGGTVVSGTVVSGTVDGETGDGETQSEGVTATALQPHKSYQLTVADDGSLRGSYTLYTTAVPTTSVVLTETLEFVGKRVLQ